MYFRLRFRDLNTALYAMGGAMIFVLLIAITNGKLPSPIVWILTGAATICLIVTGISYHFLTAAAPKESRTLTDARTIVADALVMWAQGQPDFRPDLDRQLIILQRSDRTGEPDFARNLATMLVEHERTIPSEVALAKLRAWLDIR